jgi:hypothetical protein
LMIAIPIGVMWNISVVLICISLRPGMVSIFSCVLGHLCSSLEKVLFRSVAHFFIGSLIWGGILLFELLIYSVYQFFD